MDFAFSDRVERLRSQVREVMESRVLPAEPVYAEQIRQSGDAHPQPQVMEDLKAQARDAGLWNLFLPDPTWGPGLSNLEYAPLAELMGRSLIGPEVFNCAAPDTGNMEVLARYGTSEQQRRWLVPLLAGEIRSCFCMTEPDVASSDATNIRARIERDGDHYVLNGRKWWSSGAGRDRAAVSIFMGVTDPQAERHRRQSMILVPLDAPGITYVRDLSVFGYAPPETHAELQFTDVRVPVAHLLVGEGEGFAIAQGRLGPGRIHHCMRSIGMAERALGMMCARADARQTFGRRLSEQGVVRQWIAESRLEIEQARLLTLKAAWMMDEVGSRGAKAEIAMIKIVAPRMACRILDRAIQLFGGAGVSQDTVLAEAYAGQRTLRLADGPDEVHLLSLARQELRRQRGDDVFTDPTVRALRRGERPPAGRGPAGPRTAG